MRISDWSSDVCSSDLLDYAINRYVFEAERHYGILDRLLAERRYMLGDVYTIVDMATWGWARLVPFILRADAMGQLPHPRSEERRVWTECVSTCISRWWS